jgi:hypothetical protein
MQDKEWRIINSNEGIKQALGITVLNKIMKQRQSTKCRPLLFHAHSMKAKEKKITFLKVLTTHV